MAARALGWRVLDRYGISAELLKYAESINVSADAVMPDRVHFVPFVNDEFNNVLLNMVCGGMADAAVGPPASAGDTVRIKHGHGDHDRLV